MSMQTRQIRVANGKGQRLDVVETCEKIPCESIADPNAFELGKPSYRLSTGERLNLCDGGGWTVVSTGELLTAI